MDVQEVWALLEQHQGEQFYTAKCLPFCYIIRGGALFVDRRSKSITISTVAAALQKIATRQAAGEAITGPKKIGCYGASYLYPMFKICVSIQYLKRANKFKTIKDLFRQCRADFCPALTFLLKIDG